MISLSTLIVAALVAPPVGPLASIPPKLLAPVPPPNKVIVTVNGMAVKASDVEALAWTWFSEQVREELINYLVVKTEAQKQSITLASKDVEAEVAKQIKLYAQQLGPDVNVEQALKSQGLHRSRLYMGVETQLYVKKLLLRRFDASEFVSVSTIVIKPKSDMGSDVATALQKADEAYAKLASGTPWDDVLQAYTTDPNGLKLKGVLGWRLISIFPANVQEEFKKGKLGVLTKPAQTPVGIQIFRLDKTGKGATGAELEDLKTQYVASSQTEFMTKLKKAAKIVRAP
jgi:parvulin-like peptidyl-prolyl isomerase